MKPKYFDLRNLPNRATLRFVVSLAPLIAASPNAMAADQRVVSVSSNIITTEVYDGYDPSNPGLYIPTAPHFESSGQRDALYVYQGATLTLGATANVSVKNDDDLTAFMRVGAYGSNGSLIVGNGSVLSVGQASRYANLQIGQGAGVTGTVTQNGGQVTVRGSMNVGVNGGTGNYAVNGGTLTFDHADDAGHTSLISIGFNNDSVASGTSNGTFDLTGGRVELLPVHLVGAQFGSTGLIIGNRTDTALASYGGGASGEGNGVFNQTGGVFSVGAGTGFFLSGFGDGVYNLDGGTLEIGGDSLQAKYGGGAATGTYDFNFGGGTLKVAGSNLVTLVDADLTPGTTSTIDTNGLDATWSGNLAAEGLHQVDDGGNLLLKTGLGTLNFTGASRVLDSFAINGGGVHQTAGATSAVEFMVGTGAGKTGAYVMDDGTLTINSATKADNTTPVAGSFRVGDFGGTGTFTQNGGIVTVTENGALNVGNQGGTGTYNLNGGTLNLSGGLNTLGRSAIGKPESTGTMVIAGGTLNITNNSSLIIGNNLVGAAPSSGTLTQTGGVLHVENGSALYVGAFGHGTYNLNGGVIEVGGTGLQALYGGGGATGTSTFNLGGGTVKVSGANLSASLNANLTGTNSTSFINTNGLNAVWSGNLTANGLLQHGQGGTRLLKTGAGELTFSGATRTLDTFGALAGTVRQTAGATTSVEFLVGSGGGSVGEYILDGGSLAINAANGGATAGSFRVGDFGGTGTFTQNTGTVTINTNGALNIGNQGGNGTYNLNGGSLNLGGGLNTLGRSAGGNPISHGVLNLTGGSLNLTNNSSLILGNNISGQALGTGTVTQTGGVLNVGAGSALYVAGYGNGTYNLNGGTLEVGGSGLQARYNNGSSVYAFNLGGGTVKVTGSNLNAALDANVTGTNKVSTINTNGFDATWAGNLTSAGLFQVGAGGTEFKKSGLGTLSLTGGSRVLDTFSVTGGQVTQTAGATSSVEFMVGSGQGSTASYLLSGGSLTVNSSNGGLTAGSFRVGDFEGTGTFTQTGGTVSVTTNGALNIGNQGGNGVYNLNGGTLNLGGGLNTLGRSAVGKPISHGELNIDGGVLNLTNNSSLILGNSLVGATLGTGVITQNSGALKVAAGSTLFLSGYGNGTYNLLGGSLEVGGSGLIGRYNNGSSSYALNLGSATVKVVGSDLNTAVDANLLEGKTTLFDTNGLNATWAGNLTGQGNHQIDHGGNAFAKIGEGVLTFSGATRTLDTFAVVGGSVSQTAGVTSSVELMVGTGGGSASYSLSGGTVNINPSTLEDNTTVQAGSFRVGDFGATGVFTQTGGTVNVLTPASALNIGNQGGSGTYNLNGGTLNLEGGLNILGRSQIGKPISHGVLNLGGGSLNLANGAALILGNNYSDGAAGTGTVNQTAGLLKIAAGGALYVSGYGAGTYNLNGGTLEVGGSSLHARYNNPISTYGFNLGGGTVKVAGSDLTTDVVANLSASTNSTINTNGFNATFAGFTGTGTLTKVGLGILESTGSATVGGLVVSEGTFRANQTLSVGAGGISVASGAKLIANTTLNAAPGTVMTVTGVLSGSSTLAIETNIVSGGTFAPGNSPGVVNVAADLTIASGATFAWDLTANSEAGAGVTFDLVNLSGANFTLSDGATFNILLDGSANYADGFWLGNHSWTVVDGDGTGDVILGGNVLITSNQSFNPYGSFVLTDTGDNLTLNWTAVPEPSSLLFLAAFAPFVARRRRQA